MPRTVPLDGWCDPAAAFTALFAAEPVAFWLDAGSDATDGFSWMGAPGTGDPVEVFGPDGDVFAFLRSDGALGGTAGGAIASDATVPTSGRPLGWVGWFGYELGRRTTGVELASSPLPDAALLFASRILEFDHARRTVSIVALDAAADAPDFAGWAGRVREGVAAASGMIAASVTGDGLRGGPGRAATWRHDAAEYEGLVRDCQAAITRGDAYQLCLTNTITVEGAVDPLDTYARLRASSPTHHGGFLRFGEIALLSASPEQFLRVRPDGLVITKPIKGTRPRGRTVARDVELRTELEASDKEQAENLMIVDLMRNDLGRIAELGSVRVTSLLAVESYAQVHQLVSTVEAQLAEGLTAVDALEACFPAGSMTGAPKISAMTILAELEQGPRGIYAGAFGYLGADGSLDLAMVIRSIVVTPTAATIGTGGGITALSIPIEEVEETRVKARALLDALGVVSAE
jgi:para-aminobenzoate synthetase component 1